MANICPPQLNLTYYAYDMFNENFRNAKEARTDAAGHAIKVNPSGCDLIGRVIVSGFVYALMEVMALVEFVVRLSIASLIVLPWVTTLIFKIDITHTFFETYLVNPFIFANIKIGSTACIALFAAQYFNVKDTLAASGIDLHNLIKTCVSPNALN